MRRLIARRTRGNAPKDLPGSFVLEQLQRRDQSSDRARVTLTARLRSEPFVPGSDVDSSGDRHSIGGCQKSEFQRSLQWPIQDTVQKRSRHEDQP